MRWKLPKGLVKIGMGKTASLLRAELESFAEAHQLTPREQDVVYLLLQGKGAVQRIAQELGLSQNTIHNHFKSIFRRTKTNSKAGLLALFIEQTMRHQAQLLPFVRRPTVLVADSQDATREALRASLREHGLRTLEQSDMELIDVDAAPGVDAAIARARGGVDGADAISRILHENARRKPFFIMADAPDGETQQRWLGQGAAGVFDHETPADELVFAILRHVTQSPYDRSRLERVDTDLAAQLDHRIHADIDNLGFGGAFLKVDDANMDSSATLRVGKRLHLEFALNGGAPGIGVEGEVRWTRSRSRPAKPAGVGVRFVDMQDSQRLSLERYVRQHKLETLGGWRSQGGPPRRHA